MKIFHKAAGEFEIVTGADAEEVEMFAATELADCLGRASGARIPIVREGSPGRARIVLGGAAARMLPDWERLKSNIRHDGFVMSSSDDALLICGAVPRGTLNGVYNFLEGLGFRWVFPREAEHVVPAVKTLPMGGGTRIVNPDLELRGVCIFPINEESVGGLRKIIDWMGKNRFNVLMTSVERTKKSENGWEVEWQKVSDRLLPELQKRGVILDISEHSGRHFFPTSLFEKHPEWFAMNSEGKRFATGQVCYSNAEAVEVMTENFARYAEKHPEVDIIGTWPEDGYGFCQCENCRKPGTVLKAANKIAERLEKIRPDLTVEYLSYTKETSDVPPDILPRRNMSVLVANMRVAEEWKKKIDAVGGRGVYRLHYHIADNSASRTNLALRFERTRVDCQEAAGAGLRGIIPFYIGIDTWWRSSINLHFLGQFSWDSKKSVRELLSDYCKSYYGAAAEEAIALMEALENIPMVSQSTPPPWPLWQDWPTLKEDFTGAKWEETSARFAELRRMFDACRAKGLADGVPARRFDAINSFMKCQETMFSAWRERALAVAKFERGDAEGVRRHITGAAKFEQAMISLLEKSLRDDDGVNGARADYDFFLNWRLQLDKQLLEMRTEAEKKPFIDNNPDVELFLPGLLGL